MKKIFKFIALLFRVHKKIEDYYNFWLILFNWTTIEDETKIHGDDHRSFYASNAVSDWQYNLWKAWAVFAIRVDEMRVYFEPRFSITKHQIGWISWNIPTKEYVNRGFFWLNIAPSIKKK